MLIKQINSLKVEPTIVKTNTAHFSGQNGPSNTLKTEEVMFSQKADMSHRENSVIKYTSILVVSLNPLPDFSLKRGIAFLTVSSDKPGI